MKFQNYQLYKIKLNYISRYNIKEKIILHNIWVKEWNGGEYRRNGILEVYIYGIKDYT